MTVAELRSRLKFNGQAVSGRKADLIKRLRATGAGGGTPVVNEGTSNPRSSSVDSSASSLAASKAVAKENFSPSVTNKVNGSSSSGALGTSSARKRRRRAMTRAVEQMEVEMAHTSYRGREKEVHVDDSRVDNTAS
jgi:hypothetical protein